MVQSNHSALGQGLKLYTDAMRGFVKQRLIAAYPNNWWEQGVLRALPETQRRSLNRELDKSPDTDRAELIDANLLVHIVTKRFDAVFAGTFHNFRQTQSWLAQIAEARNSWAHSRSGDMLADDAAYALYAMVQVLTAARLPEADAVEDIRRAVLGMGQEAAPNEVPAPVNDAPSARPGDLPYWWQVCTPRDGFQDPAHIDESLFAATLGGVFAGAARPEYLDPAHFLSHTYFTKDLTQMVRDTVERMNGGDGPSVTEVQTPFGGGKTHALLTLYHLIKNPEQALAVPGVREALGDQRVPANARVLVFDGHEAGAEAVTKENGASVGTLWGELTHQVDPGAYLKLMVDSDGRGEAPGNAVFRQVLQQASPCLILLDEVVSYLVKLRFSGNRRTTNLYRQTVQFLQEMLQLASNVPGVCVLLSLPRSLQEFGGINPDQLKNEISVLGDLQPRADRVVTKRTPISDDEIYLLMSKRLFATVDADAAERVARAYRGVYEKAPGHYDPAVRTDDYLKQQQAAYPLHPELIDVIYKKWSTASDFPRTRATLQLLANVVADQWSHHREAYSIQSAHVDLERERIRTRMVSAAGAGGGYEGVVAADIIGGDAHADMQDQGRGGDYAHHRIGRGVATTLLMHSFGGMERTGATKQDLRLGTVAPNVGPEYVTEILDSLEQTLWYVHKEGEALRFQTKPNIYRVIAQAASGQPDSTVAERLRAEIDGAVGNAEGFRVLPWAGADGHIADNPDPAIAVLEPRYAVTDSGGKTANPERVQQLWDRVGGGLREWRNALILVTPDQELWDRAKEAVREVLAYDSVIASSEGQALSQAEVRVLKSRGDDKKKSLKTSVTTAYRWVFYPQESSLASVSLPMPATAGEKIAHRVVERLSAQDYGAPKVLPKMSANYFNAKVAPQLWKDRTEPLDLSEALRRFPQWTFLPILPYREETLRECIREGVSQRLWAVAIGDIDTSSYRELVETPDALNRYGVLFDGSASLVEGELLQLIREQVHPGTTTLPDDEPEVKPKDTDSGTVPEKPVIPPPKRLARVRLKVQDLAIAKTNNLQPYLFKVLQEQDAGAEVDVTIQVSSSAGIPQDVLEQRIVEAFDQLGIALQWEEG